MVSRRNFLLVGGAGLGAGATLLTMGGAHAGITASQSAAETIESLAPAPQAFVALADELSGKIGMDRVLINRTYKTLNSVIPSLGESAEQLAKMLPQVTEISDPQARLSALESKGAALKDLFLRMNTALYLGTVDDKDSQRSCIGFETTASAQIVADSLQPPSYCVGSPNFWVDPPAVVNPEGATHA